MEKNRPFEKKFWLPRKDTLIVVAQDLQDLEDGKYKFYGLSLPPRVGKSTIVIFFLSWVIGRRPNSHNAMSGHSGMLADGFYTEVLNLPQLQKQIMKLGVRHAYTLDGGQTATIVMNDEVINHVSYGAERYISDIIYFATAIPNKK